MQLLRLFYIDKLHSFTAEILFSPEFLLPDTKLIIRNLTQLIFLIVTLCA